MSARQLSPTALAVAALLLLTAATVHLHQRATGGTFIYGGDDVYIEMATAQHLAEDGVWGITKYEFSGSTTSLLWPALLAATHMTFGWSDWNPLGLNVVFAVALLGLSQFVLDRFGIGRLEQVFWLLLMVIGLPLSVLAVGGMEHTAQGVGAVAFAYAASAGDWRRMACLAPVLVAIRPDLLSVIAAGVLLSGSYRPPRRAALIIGAALLPLALYAVVSVAHSWPPVPAPVMVKQRIETLDWLSMQGWLEFAGGEIVRLVQRSRSLFAALVITMALMYIGRQSWRAPAHRLAAVFLVASLFHLLFGLVGWSNNRYEAYLIAIGTLSIAAISAHIRVNATGKMAAQACTVAAVLLATVLLSEFTRLTQGSIRESEFIRHHPLEAARLVRDYIGDRTLIVDDYLGTFARESNARILDLAGLANADAARSIQALPPDRGMTPDTVHQLAEARDSEIAVVRDGWVMPLEWTCVEQWQDSDTSEVSFYFFAKDREVARALSVGLSTLGNPYRERVIRAPCDLVR